MMDADEPIAHKKRDLVALLAQEDLDRLSIAELSARITALETEIARCQKKQGSAQQFKASADALFSKKPQ